MARTVRWTGICHNCRRVSRWALMGWPPDRNECRRVTLHDGTKVEVCGACRKRWMAYRSFELPKRKPHKIPAEKIALVQAMRTLGFGTHAIRAALKGDRKHWPIIFRAVRRHKPRILSASDVAAVTCVLLEKLDEKVLTRPMRRPRMMRSSE